MSHVLPYPIRQCLFTLEISFRTSAGTPTDPTSPDTELSSDGGATSSDCTNEITTGSTNGVGYLTLTSTELNNNVVWVIAKSSNCLTSLVALYPRILASVGTGTLSAGSAGGGTLGTLLAYDVTGCFIQTTGGTGGASGAFQARKIVTYNTGTGAFTVTPNWETTPDATTTYSVLLPEGVTLGMLKTLNSTSPIQTAGDIYLYLTTNLGALGANLSAIPKTGFKLASDGLAAVTAWTVAITGNVTGNLSGSVGSISGTTFPSNFSSLVIDSTGRVNAFLIGILTTVFTEGATGRIAAAFKQFFNIASPAATMDHGILVDTATDLTNKGNGSGLSAIPWNAAWDAEVQSEVQDAIEVNHLDHFIAVADPGGVVADSSFLAKLVSKSATPSFASYVNTTDSLEALRDRGDAAWITATGFSTHSAADVWAVGTRVLTAGTNIVLAKGVGVTGFNDIAAADVWAVGTRALTDKAGFTISGTITTLDALATHGDLAWATATGFVTTTHFDTTIGTPADTIADDIAAIPTSSPPTATAIAEAVFLVDIADVEDTAPEHSLCYVVLASSEFSVSGNNMTVKKTTGATFATKTLTKTAGDDPVRGVS